MFKRADDVTVEESGTTKVEFNAENLLVVKPETNLKETLISLLGKLKDEVRGSLEELKIAKKITDFRLAPLGSAFTGDFVSGRVTLTYDANGRVVTADEG